MLAQMDRPVQIYDTYADITVCGVFSDLEKRIGISHLPGGSASRVGIFVVLIGKEETAVFILVSGVHPVLERKVAIDHRPSSYDLDVSADVIVAAGPEDHEWRSDIDPIIDSAVSEGSAGAEEDDGFGSPPRVRFEDALLHEPEVLLISAAKEPIYGFPSRVDVGADDLVLRQFPCQQPRLSSLYGCGIHNDSVLHIGDSQGFHDQPPNIRIFSQPLEYTHQRAAFFCEYGKFREDGIPCLEVLSQVRLYSLLFQRPFSISDPAESELIEQQIQGPYIVCASANIVKILEGKRIQGPSFRSVWVRSPSPVPYIPVYVSRGFERRQPSPRILQLRKPLVGVFPQIEESLVFVQRFRSAAHFLVNLAKFIV